MSIRDKFKSWPDGKKKIFSLTVAGVLTLIIAIVWFSLNPPAIFTKGGSEIKTNGADYFGDSLKKIRDQYNSVIDQISNITGTSSTSTTQ